VVRTDQKIGIADPLYKHLKSDDGTSAIFAEKDIMPPFNWELWQTSSWLNYFLGRGHRRGKY
jgi:hypothetical protein